MVALPITAMLAAIATAAVIPRDSASANPMIKQQNIMTDLENINAGAKALGSAVESWHGGILGAIPIQGAYNHLAIQIMMATKDLEDPAFAKAMTFDINEDANFKKVTEFLDNELTTNVASITKAIMQKKSDIVKMGLAEQTTDAIQELHYNIEAYEERLTHKMPDDSADIIEDLFDFIIEGYVVPVEDEMWRASGGRSWGVS